MKTLITLFFLITSIAHAGLRNGTYACTDLKSLNVVYLTFADNIITFDHNASTNYKLTTRKHYTLMEIFSPIYDRWIPFPLKLIIEDNELVELVDGTNNAICKMQK